MISLREAIFLRCEQNYLKWVAETMLVPDFSMFFNPASIAIVGATDDPKKFGHEVTKNIVSSLKDSSKHVDIFPINPKKSEVMGLKSYRNLREIGKPIDLVIVLVPKKAVKPVVEDAIANRVKGIIIVTAGFGEYSEEGKREEQYLAKLARDNNARIIGPNCVGIINTNIPINASFIITPPPGKIAVISQSGSMAAAIIYGGIPLGYFANIGNQADISETEILEYFLSLDEVSVVGMYLETLKDPIRFYHTLKNSSKPIVVFKTGRTEQGAKSASSHTGSIATSHVAFTAAIKQTHQHLANDEIEFVGKLKALSRYSPQEQMRIAIITNAGGPAVALSDLLAEHGFSLTEISAVTKAQIKEHFPPLVKPGNPLDIIASARENEYRLATKAFLEDENIDVLIPLCVVPTFLEMNPKEHMEGVLKAIQETNTSKIILPLWLSGDLALPGRKLAEKKGIPTYGTLRELIAALEALKKRYVKISDMDE